MGAMQQQQGVNTGAGGGAPNSFTKGGSMGQPMQGANNPVNLPGGAYNTGLGQQGAMPFYNYNNQPGGNWGGGPYVVGGPAQPAGGNQLNGGGYLSTGPAQPGNPIINGGGVLSPVGPAQPGPDYGPYLNSLPQNLGQPGAAGYVPGNYGSVGKLNFTPAGFNPGGNAANGTGGGPTYGFNNFTNMGNGAGMTGMGMGSK